MKIITAWDEAILETKHEPDYKVSEVDVGPVTGYIHLRITEQGGKNSAHTIMTFEEAMALAAALQQAVASQVITIDAQVEFLRQMDDIPSDRLAGDTP